MKKNLLRIEKFEPERENLINEVIAGFEKPQKQLPCKLFYDKRGSALFDEICGLEEYYPTRTEVGIMKENIDEICSFLGKHCLLVELGSGSSIKIRLLLDNLRSPSGYVPIDISEEHLMESVKTLAEDYPEIENYARLCRLHPALRLSPIRLPFFSHRFFLPGLHHRQLLSRFRTAGSSSRIAKRAGRGSGLLIGVDLVKDIKTLEDAYNDAEGRDGRIQSQHFNKIKP